MIGYVLARRYAQAIIDLASEQGVVEKVGENLKLVAQLFADHPALVHVFSDPTVAHEIKARVLTEILSKGDIHDLTARFIKVLLEKNRMLGIDEIARVYQSLEDRLEKRIRARVVTAHSLEDESLERVRGALAKLSGMDVVLETEVDESILGGIIAYVGGQVFDGSLKNQLQQIKDSLSKG